MPLLDRFCNQAYINVVESAANTLTTQKLESGYSVLGSIAWVIHRLEYGLSSAIAQMNSTGDTAQIGLVSLPSTTLTTFSMGSQAVYDFIELIRYDTGTAANANFMQSPYTKDFTNLPGGGLLIAPNPLYLAVKGAGCAGAITVPLRIYFTELELDSDLYRELFQSRTLVS